jgi:uncharacterized RDD family membrane protein YckC
MENKYPTLLSRIQSITIDTLLLIAFMAIFTIMLDGYKNVPDSLRMWLFISLIMYEPLCTTFGATYGNYKLGIRVRKNSDESKRINIFQALIRYFFKTIFGWISFLGIFTNSKKRAFHDQISGSVMINTK